MQIRSLNLSSLMVGSRNQLGSETDSKQTSITPAQTACVSPNGTCTDYSTNSLCNCRNKNECPTSGNCLAKRVIYRKGTVTTLHKRSTKTYIDMTGNDFKQRYRNHMKSFKNSKYRNETELSKSIWRQRMENRDYLIKWSIFKHANTRRHGTRRYNRCLEEKLHIMKSNKEKLLNSRSKIFSRCGHSRTKQPAYQLTADTTISQLVLDTTTKT